MRTLSFRRAVLIVFWIASLTVGLVVVSSNTPIAAHQKPPATPPDYASRARDVVAALAARRFEEVFADFNASHGPNLSPRSIGNGWDQVLARSGKFQKIEAVQVIERRYHVATVTCIFDGAKRDVLIYFDDDGRIAALNYPSPAPSASAPATASWTAPPYADPSTFHEVAVSLVDGQWTLPGTLTLPNGNGPFSAVVFVSGSGANDADVTLGSNKISKDLAWGLASKGIAVLRYPKRTYVYGGASSPDPGTFTVKDEYLDDARAAVAQLASRRDIDAKRVFVAGHSEGGFLAPRIADEDPGVAGIIILEGNTRSIAQGAVDQLRYLASLPNPGAAAIRTMLPEVEAEAAAMASPDLKPGTTLKLLNSTIPSSYVLDLRRYDPGVVAARLRIPIYVAQGGRDYQVTDIDFASWQEALAGHHNATLKLYPTLDHLLVPGVGPSTPSQYAEPGRHVSADVVRDLAAWISVR